MQHSSVMYRLADGREFPENTVLPRYERELLAEHIERLASAGSREARAALLADLTRACGAPYGAKLKEAYAAEHARRVQEAQYGV